MNPANSNLYIELKNNNKAEHINVYDLLGNKVCDFTIENQSIVNISVLNISNGIYTFEVTGKDFSLKNKVVILR